MLTSGAETTRLGAQGISYIPYNQTFYHGVLGNDYDVSGRRGSEYHPIATFNKQAAIEGKLDEILTPLDHESYRAWDRYRRTGEFEPRNLNFQAALDKTSLANITRVELLTNIINEMYKKVYLHLGATFMPVPKLVLDYPVIKHMKVRGKANLIGKRQKAQVDGPEFTQTSFDLATYGKLQRQIDIPDEDELTAKLSPTKHMISDVTKVMSQDINAIIKEDGLDQFSTSSFTNANGHWGTVDASSNISKRNPLVDIQRATEAMTHNHADPDTIVMNRVTFAHFTGNTFVRGYEQMFSQKNDGTFTLAKLPGLTFIIDADIPLDEVFIYDKSALTVGDGPMVTEAFRDPKEGVAGHVIRKWIQPVVNVDLKKGFGRRLHFAAASS